MANSNEQMCSTISTKVWNDKVKECDNWKEKCVKLEWDLKCAKDGLTLFQNCQPKKIEFELKNFREKIVRKLKKVRLGTDIPCSSEVARAIDNPAEHQILEAIEELVVEVFDATNYKEHSEEVMDQMAEAFGFDECYACDTCFDWSCFVRDCPVKDLKEENQKLKKLHQDFEELQTMSKKLMKFQEREISELKQNLKEQEKTAHEFFEDREELKEDLEDMKESFSEQLDRSTDHYKELNKVKKELKEEKWLTTRMAYEKYWMLGEDGMVEPEIDQVKQDFKDGKLKEETYKYLLEFWGYETEEEDEDPHN